MTITVAQHTGTDAMGGTATNPTITYASAQTAGNLNAVIIFWGDTTNSISSVSDSQGNTYSLLGNHAASGITWSVWYCPSIAAHAAGNVVTFHGSGALTSPEAWILEGHTTTGSWSAGPFDFGHGTTGTAMSTGTDNLTGTPTLGFAAFVCGSGAWSSAGSGWTALDINSGADASEWQAFTSNGNETATANQNASSSWDCVVGYFYTAAAAAVIPTIFYGAPSPTQSDVSLPPRQTVTRGSGNPAQQPNVLTNTHNNQLGASAAEDRGAYLLPPPSYVGSGGSDPFNGISRGAGNPAHAPNILTNNANSLLDSFASADLAPQLLPPPQYVTSGSSDVFDNLSRGSGNAAHAPNILTNTDNALLGTSGADPMAPYLLPPPQLRISGFGQAAQMTPLAPLYGLAFLSTVSLPPTDAIVPGAGLPTQSWSLVSSTPPPSGVDLPAITAVLAGSGNAAQPPNILNNGDNAPMVSSAAFAPLEPDLPPVTALLAGAGAPPQPTTLRPVLIIPRDYAALPPTGQLLAGAGNAAQQPYILLNSDNSTMVTSAAFAPVVPDLPPAQYVIKGAGNAAAVAVTYIGIGVLVDRPIDQKVIKGAGNAAQSPSLQLIGLPAPSADLPQPQQLIKGFGAATIVQIPLVTATVVNSVDLPIRQLLIVGAGAPAGPTTLFTQGLPAPASALPASQALIAGFGAPAAPPNVLNNGDNAPLVSSAAYGPVEPDLPPVQTRIAGAGAPAAPASTSYGVAQSYALLPPAQSLTPGAGSPAQPPATYYGVVATVSGIHTVALLPPTQATFAGAGFAAVAPVTVSDVPQATAPLPPQTALLKGAGQAAQAPFIMSIRPAPSADLPPAQSRFAGFGNAAVVGTIGYGVPPRDAPALPPSSAIDAGFGMPAQAFFVVLSVPVPQSADLPPRQALGMGAGNAAQPWAVFSGLPAPGTDLPTIQRLFAGVGRPAQQAFVSLGQPAPFADVPPRDSLFAGFGVPTQAAATFVGLPSPYVLLPPQDAMMAGAGSPSQAPIITYGIASPSIVDRPAATATIAGANKPPTAATLIGLPAPSAPEVPPPQSRFSGAGKPAQAPYILYGAPPVVPASPDLPPPQARFAGFGLPAQPTSLFPFMALPQATPPLPPTQSLFAGSGQAAQAAVFIISVPAPEESPLPPRQSVFYSLVFLDTLHFVTLPPTRMLVPVLAPSKLAS